MKEHDCHECPLADRRAFLSEVARVMSSLMLTTGLWPARAEGFPIRSAIGVVRDGLVVYPIPETEGATIDREAQVIVVRYQQSVYAFVRTCPHQNTALRWRANEQRFRCPKHDSQYQPDGRFIDGRATRGMDRFAVWRDGGNVVVDNAQVFKQDEDPAGWEAARVDL